MSRQHNQTDALGETKFTLVSLAMLHEALADRALINRLWSKISVSLTRYLVAKELYENCLTPSVPSKKHPILCSLEAL